MKIEMIGSKDNPIVVDSLRNEINFLNNLVTENGDYVLYHRLGSTQNIIYITMNDENMDHEELIKKIIGYFKIKL